MAKKANDQQLSELNDEIERLKEEKKKFKQQLDNEQTLHMTTKTQMDKQEEDILKLENEIKSLIQVKPSILQILLHYVFLDFACFLFLTLMIIRNALIGGKTAERCKGTNRDRRIGITKKYKKFDSKAL